MPRRFFVTQAAASSTASQTVSSWDVIDPRNGRAATTKPPGGLTAGPSCYLHGFTKTGGSPLDIQARTTNVPDGPAIHPLDHPIRTIFHPRMEVMVQENVWGCHCVYSTLCRECSAIACVYLCKQTPTNSHKLPQTLTRTDSH